MDKLKERKLLNRRDFWLLAGLSIALALWYGMACEPQRGSYARIAVNRQAVEWVDLSVDRIFALEAIPNVRFQVRNGAIAFIESDCPDQICVRSGFLDRTGQMAACLPNRCSLVIWDAGGNNQKETDMIAY